MERGQRSAEYPHGALATEQRDSGQIRPLLEKKAENGAETVRKTHITRGSSLLAVPALQAADDRSSVPDRGTRTSSSQQLRKEKVPQSDEVAAGSSATAMHHLSELHRPPVTPCPRPLHPQ